MSDEAIQTKGFLYSCDVDVNVWEEYNVFNNVFKASVSIGEDYYKSGPHKSKDLALCEVKGWLEGVKAKIEGVIQSIERQINENNQDTAGAGHEG